MEEVGHSVKARILVAMAMAAMLSRAADSLADQVDRKIDLIESGKAKPGSVFVFTAIELNAFARVKAREAAPEGVGHAVLQSVPNETHGPFPLRFRFGGRRCAEW